MSFLRIDSCVNSFRQKGNGSAENFAKDIAMGIITDPGYELSGRDCAACWPAGQTPKKLYLSVQGLSVNAQTPYTAPLPPPNGIWLLEQHISMACTWIFSNATFDFELYMGALLSKLEIRFPGGYAFWTLNDGPCAQFFTNLGQPEGAYAGGVAVSSPRPDFSDRPSLKGVMGLMNIEPAAKTFAEIFPKSGGYMVYKFNLKSDKTNVKFLIDPAEY